MKFKVYHKDWSSNQELKSPDSYNIVAWVEAYSLDDVFRLTNSIEDYWWNNEEVDAMVTKTRSTSVGDVIVDTVSEVAYTVDMFGFSVNKWFK